MQKAEEFYKYGLCLHTRKGHRVWFELIPSSTAVRDIPLASGELGDALLGKAPCKLSDLTQRRNRRLSPALSASV